MCFPFTDNQPYTNGYVREMKNDQLYSTIFEGQSQMKSLYME